MFTLHADHRDYLLAHRIAHLATAGPDGRPHVVPLCFALVDGLIYTPLDRKPKRVRVERLRRVRDLRANPHVCLLVDDYDEDWSRLSWLQVRGDATIIPPGDEQRRAIASLRERYVQYRTMQIEDSPMIGITPVEVVGWRASDLGAYVAGDLTPL